VADASEEVVHVEARVEAATEMEILATAEAV